MTIPITTEKETLRQRCARLIKAREVAGMTAPEIVELAYVIESFPQYHGNNPYLIWKQWKDAGKPMSGLTQVYTFKDWIKRGRVVRSGEGGMGIYQPIPKLRERSDEQEADRDRRSEGLAGCKTVAIFDISQTDELEPGAKRPTEEPELAAALPLFPDTPALPSPSLAMKLRTQAEGMQAQIDHKLAPAIANQRPTRRRMGIAAGMKRHGDRLYRIQQMLVALADAHEAGTIPPILAHISTRKAVELLHDATHPRDGEEGARSLQQARITSPETFEAARLALLELAPTAAREIPVAQQIKDAIQELAFHGIPGWYPTPPRIVADLMQQADIQSGMRVLEPSAGAGHIADLVQTLHPDTTLDVVEINHDLRHILELKGYAPVAHDFLTYQPSELYDRIVMNPPFADREDVQHVKYAYALLAPGGRLVSVMSNGTLTGGDAPAKKFRTWLDLVQGEVTHRYDRGEFMASEVSTGVATRVVVIDKPADAATE